MTRATIMWSLHDSAMTLHLVTTSNQRRSSDNLSGYVTPWWCHDDVSPWSKLRSANRLLPTL